MGFRFRKSIKILPNVKLNLSQSGVGVSVGKKGFSFSKRISKGFGTTLAIMIFLAIATMLNLKFNGSADGFFIEKSINAEIEQVTIVKVSDGDTITVKFEDGKEKKVRLIGIDTPESVHVDKSKNTEYGDLASDYTKGRLPIGKNVYLTKDTSNEDKYGRLLRYLWLEKPENQADQLEIREKMYNSELLLKGYAVAKAYKPDTTHSELFMNFQKEAERSSAGLWGQGFEP